LISTQIDAEQVLNNQD
jgi:hypothetical protein